MIFYGKDECVVRPCEPLVHIDTAVASEFYKTLAGMTDWIKSDTAAIDSDTPTIVIDTYPKEFCLTGDSTDK